MNFRKQDPGAVQFGNFINYYQFNAVNERIKLLPNDTNIWLNNKFSKNYYVLDVGCNTGDLTKELQQFLKISTNCNVYILGIDIDYNLIERAKMNNLNENFITYSEYDIMTCKNDASLSPIDAFFNLHSINKFDAICCFSITMWIHLNHHDNGLCNFLQKLCNIAELFVVEPQPWKCYQTAERRLKKTGEIFPYFLKLKWRSNVEDDIQKYLEDELHRIKVFSTDRTKWKRQICFYR